MDILNTYIELIYGFEITDVTILNKLTSVIGYMKDNGFTDEEIINHLIHKGPEIDELFTELTENTLYYNNELVIESPAPIWHPEKQSVVYNYYREPRCKFSMDNLLNMYYSKLNIPVELRDRKRDTGAFEHMLNKFKFKDFSALDYIMTLIKLAEQYEVVPNNPFKLEEYSQEAFEKLNILVSYDKTRMVWRDK